MRSIFRLQDLAIKYYRVTATLFLVGITPFMLYGNYLTPLKSVITKDAVMNRKNHVRQMDDYVTERKRDGFRSDEPVVITKKFPQGIKTIKDLRSLLDFHNFLKKKFGEQGLDTDRLVSLAVTPRFIDTGIELEGDPYINSAMLRNPRLDIEGWKKEVKGDRSVYGKYVSRDFKIALFYFYAPDDDEQIALAWKIKSALEQKKFGWVHRFLETDIHPIFKDVGLAGWIIGRWIIGQLSIINILAIAILTSLLILPGFRRALGSWTQAIVSLVMIFLAIIWTRGTVGLLSLAGSDVGESPYLLFSYAICILQGVSFPLQIFVAYNQAIEEGFSPVEAWRKAMGKMNRLISLLAGISIGSFISLWWSFGVRPIVDMSIASTIGLSSLWTFSRYLLPAMYIWLETKEERFQKIAAGPIISQVLWLIMKLEEGFGFIFVEIPLKRILRINGFLLAQKNIVAASAAIVLGLAGLTIWAFHEIVWPNQKVIARSKPLEFTPGKITDTTSQELNQEERPGFDGLNFLVEPKPQWITSEGIYNPRFLDMVSQIENGIANFPKKIGAREISTVIQGIERISQQSFHKTLPKTEQEAGYAFLQIQNKFKSVIQGVMFYHNGIRITVTCAADDSNNMAYLRDAVISYVRKNFPDLKINAFGRANVYPEVDREIREGKPWNIISDQNLIYFVFLVWLLVVAWKRKDELLPIVNPWLGALVMNVPTWFATVTLFIIMVYGQIPMDLANVVISAFAINATSDFSFHLLEAFIGSLGEGKNGREAMIEVLQRHSRTIVEDAFLNNRVFFPLYLFSSFVPIQRIGIMMLLMLTLCLIGILILVPPLLVLAVRKGKPQKISSEIRIYKVIEEVG